MEWIYACDDYQWIIIRTIFNKSALNAIKWNESFSPLNKVMNWTTDQQLQLSFCLVFIIAHTSITSVWRAHNKFITNLAFVVKIQSDLIVISPMRYISHFKVLFVHMLRLILISY